MRDVRQALWITLASLASIALIVGGISLSLVEGNMLVATTTYTLTSTLPVQITPSPVDSPTPPISTATPYTPSPVVTRSETWTLVISPSPSICSTPLGWTSYAIHSGDTIESLAEKYNLSTLDIVQSNCLSTTELFSGQVLSMPPMPTNTPVACGAPRTWIIYIVQPGDTLYHLGQLYGVPYSDIQRANCLSSATIHIGQAIYIPPWSPHLPSPATPVILIPTFYLPTDTPVTTSTGTMITSTSTAELTETTAPTETETATPTSTPTIDDPESTP